MPAPHALSRVTLKPQLSLPFPRDFAPHSVMPPGIHYARPATEFWRLRAEGGNAVKDRLPGWPANSAIASIS